MTSPAELSSLKQQVAELWRRFKTEDQSTPSDDPQRRALAEQTRTLDLKQKELMLRRDALRHELELERARQAGRAPLFKTFGFLLGLGVGVAGVCLGLDDFAAATLGLSPLAGVAMLVAVVPFPLLVPRR